MKLYYHHKHHHFLDYFNDPIPDAAVIYMSDISFQYNEREGRYTEFISNPMGTIFVAAKRDHKFYYIKEVIHLISQVIQLILGS